MVGAQGPQRLTTACHAAGKRMRGKRHRGDGEREEEERKRRRTGDG